MSELDDPDIAWCVVDDHIILLDIARDRYCRLCEARNRELLSRLTDSGQQGWRQPHSLPRPDDWHPPQLVSPDVETGPFSLSEVARAMWVQRRVEKRLSTGLFREVLLSVSRLSEKRHLVASGGGESARATIRAFEYARLLRTAADRCLPRSIALAICLASRGQLVRVVLGVRAAPFSAHCWAQQGPAVLNDSVEEVRRYHPILIV